MNYGRKIASLLVLVAACGDDEPKMTATSVTTSTTAPTTNNPGTTNDPPTSDTEDATDGTSNSTDATSSPPTTGTSSVEGGPMFLSFSANVPMLTQNESVTFTALLTDPDGVADIVGGTLRSADESIEFGPFIAAGEPGSYSFPLSWMQLHQAQAIEFEGESQRAFHAVFFDQAGHKATGEVTIDLVCESGAACNGACTDLALDGLNCGTCGRSCDGGEDACDSGACAPTLSRCINFDEGFDTCTVACQSFGETCAENACGAGITTRTYNNLMWCEDDINGANKIMACDEPQMWNIGAMTIKCCCTDTK